MSGGITLCNAERSSALSKQSRLRWLITAPTTLLQIPEGCIADENRHGNWTGNDTSAFSQHEQKQYPNIHIHRSGCISLQWRNARWNKNSIKTAGRIWHRSQTDSLRPRKISHLTILSDRGISLKQTQLKSYFRNYSREFVTIFKRGRYIEEYLC